MASQVYTDMVVRYFMNSIRSYNKVVVPKDFHSQMDSINKVLKQDKSSLIWTLYNFMVNAATVDYKFETGSENLDIRLNNWKNTLNSNVGPDIPSGLRALSGQYFMERWKSSFIILNIQYSSVDGWKLPTNMWFTDGAHVRVGGEMSKLGGYEYFIGRKDGPKIKDIKTRKVIIRKPYNMWYDQWPTPYLVGNGALFHGLSKILKLDKQNDLMAEIIPLMFLSKIGNDISAKDGTLPTPTELKKHETKIKEMQEAYKTGGAGFNAGTFPYDVDFSQDIPDITKFINDSILKPSDKNILSSMGMIEMEGFAKSRQETILNPKVLVDEVTSAVLDWRDMLVEVAIETFELNKNKHIKDANRAVRVVPGLIKAFLTNDEKVLIRSVFDRGSVGHEDLVSILPFDWETSMQRRISEREGGLDKELYPHIIMNQEQHSDDPDINPELTKENAPEKKKSEKDVETSEIEDFQQSQRMQAVIKGKSDKELIMAPYDNIDQLPDNIKNVLPIPAQIIFLKAFNAAIKDGKSDEAAFKIAWDVVKKKYRPPKDNEKKWQKK